MEPTWVKQLQVVYSTAGSWPYPQIIDQTGKVFQFRDNHYCLLRTFVKNGRKTFYKFWPWYFSELPFFLKSLSTDWIDLKRRKKDNENRESTIDPLNIRLKLETIFVENNETIDRQLKKTQNTSKNICCWCFDWVFQE